MTQDKYDRFARCSCDPCLEFLKSINESLSFESEAADAHTEGPWQSVLTSCPTYAALSNFQNQE